MPNLSRNPTLLCAFHGLQMALFPMAILTVFFRDDIGMSMEQIMVLQGSFGLAMALFEFPSGYLADRLGYRRSLLIAAALNAVGWSIYTRADGILGIYIGELILGVGLSLVSGSDSAMLYESLEELGEEEEFALWNGRVRFWGQFCEGTAAVMAGFLYAAWSRLPFAAEVGIWVVNFGVAYLLVEPLRHRPPGKENFKQVKAMLVHLFVESPALRAIFFITIVLGMASFIPVWTIQLYATDAGVDGSILGFIWAAANYTVAIGSLMSRPLASRLGLSGLVLICIALIACGYTGLALTHAVWGVGFYFFLVLMRGFFGPALHHEEQRLIPSRDRAGFLSLRSLIFRSSFLFLGPATGWLVDHKGQHFSMATLGFVLPAVALWAWVLLRRDFLRSKAQA